MKTTFLVLIFSIALGSKKTEIAHGSSRRETIRKWLELRKQNPPKFVFPNQKPESKEEIIGLIADDPNVYLEAYTMIRNQPEYVHELLRRAKASANKEICEIYGNHVLEEFHKIKVPILEDASETFMLMIELFYRPNVDENSRECAENKMNELKGKSGKKAKRQRKKASEKFKKYDTLIRLAESVEVKNERVKNVVFAKDNLMKISKNIEFLDYLHNEQFNSVFIVQIKPILMNEDFGKIMEEFEEQIQKVADAKIDYHLIASGGYEAKFHEYVLQDHEYSELTVSYIASVLKISKDVLSTISKAIIVGRSEACETWRVYLVGEEQLVNYAFKMLDLLFHYAGKNEVACCVCSQSGLIDLHPHKEIHENLYNNPNEKLKWIRNEEKLRDAILQKKKFQSHRLCFDCFKDHFTRYKRNFCPVCVKEFSNKELTNLEKFANANRFNKNKRL